MRVALICVALLCAACPKAPDGDFGPGKPVKNNGTLGNKPIVEAPATPDFEHALDVVPSFAAGKLTVTLKIKPGYHAYAPGEEIGKPVAMTVDAPWTIDGAVQVPEGQKRDLGDLGKSVILEGDVPLTAAVKGGSGDVKGVVEAQVCTDKACDRPKKHPFTVPSA